MKCQEKRITLRKMVKDDFDLVKPWFDNHDVSKWLKSVYRLGRYNPIMHISSLNSQTNHIFVASLSDKPIGIAGLSYTDRIDRSAMIWYLIAENQDKGKGLGELLVRSIVRAAFDSFKLHSVYAYVAETNIPSIRVLEKNNFRRGGVHRESHTLNGVFLNRIFFDLIRGEEK
jgi:ribosomal-protein-alanine N-acetyltransferase